MNLLVGRKIKEIVGCFINSEQIVFKTEQGNLILSHQRDCCEELYVDEIFGDPEDLIGGIVLLSEERSSDENSSMQEWTFYHIITDKGDLTIKWYGSSNGYYSMSVSVVWENTVS